MKSRNKPLSNNNKDTQLIPIPNPNGGDPTCQAGSEIDYDFDILDPLDPPFTCKISKLINNRINITADKLLHKVNQPESNITEMTKYNGILKTPPAAGGGRKTKKIRLQNTKRHNLKSRKHTRQHRYKK